MQGGNFLEEGHVWYPLKPLGITHPLTALNSEVLVSTWFVLAVLAMLCYGAYYTLTYRPQTLLGYALKLGITAFINLIEQSIGMFVERYYLFITSLFIFIIACNWIALLPGVEEPTTNINTTLALGITAFIYSQKEIIQSHGIHTFLKEYFLPFNIVFPLNIIAGLLLLPLRLLGEFSSIISLSLRLFGNIFGGSIITSIYTKALGNSIIFNTLATFLGINLLITGFFIFFEGFLQAFVFSILTLTNLAIIAQKETE